MGEHFAVVGARLEAAVESYNPAVGSLESTSARQPRASFATSKRWAATCCSTRRRRSSVLPREMRAEDLLPAPDMGASD